MNEATSSLVEIRRLWPSDKEAFHDHLLSLGPRSRRVRFGGGMSDDFLVHYAEKCFGKGDLIYGAYQWQAGRRSGAALQSAIWSEQAPFGRHIHAEAAFLIPERSATRLREADLNVLSKLGNQGLEWRLEP